MSSPETNPKPVFIEVADGVRIAANIKVEKYLRFRDGQGLYDQPPFSWLLTQTERIPESIFKPDIDQELVLKYLIFAAAQERGVELRVSESEYIARLSPSLSDGQRRKKIEIRNRFWRTDFQKWLGPVLAEGTDLHDTATLYQLANAIQSVTEYLRDYPDVFDYLYQMAVERDEKIFAPNGTPFEAKLRGEYRVKTYAGFAAYRRTLNNDWSKWVGLESSLPDDTAALAREADQDDSSLAYIISRSFLGTQSK